MASVFWDAKGTLLIDYLPTGQTIKGQYYVNLLDQLQEMIREKMPGLVRKTVIFHQDNPRSHKSAITMAKLHELRYELLPHPPYSPDLLPSDFHLLPKLKIFLGGGRYPTTEELTAELERYYAGLE
ncbi:histone-lysine N-methyltransferase SETMAR-like [Halyomorpha halys]|uniref:histone-lysine N-methyltransferase SETMAR-like n=1 Tax=Halyomorpha halys TaxID=286706 RepID=UPI0006D4D71E|nr:histone-lysine N-methyltransferase SETMAR-like [Halyomorpha halys]